MSVTADLIDFARDSGTIYSVYRGNESPSPGTAGAAGQHIWDTTDSRRPQVEKSEYLEPQCPP